MLTIDGAVAAGQIVQFQGSTGMLVLDNSSACSGAILGFTGDGTLSGSDQIDLKDINFNSASFSDNYDAASGILTVSDGVHTANLHFGGSYQLENFKFADDGENGTIVYDPPVPLSDADTTEQVTTTQTTSGGIFRIGDVTYGSDVAATNAAANSNLYLTGQIAAAILLLGFHADELKNSPVP